MITKMLRDMSKDYSKSNNTWH